MSVAVYKGYWTLNFRLLRVSLYESKIYDSNIDGSRSMYEVSDHVINAESTKIRSLLRFSTVAGYEYRSPTQMPLA